jgi:hypothetical protein
MKFFARLLRFRTQGEAALGRIYVDHGGCCRVGLMAEPNCQKIKTLHGMIIIVDLRALIQGLRLDGLVQKALQNSLH